MLDFQLLEIFSLLIFFIGINLILNGIAGKFDNNSSWLTIFPVSTFLFPVSLYVLSTSFFPRCQYLVPLTKSLNYHQYFPFRFPDPHVTAGNFCGSIILTDLHSSDFYFFLLKYQSFLPVVLFFRFPFSFLSHVHQTYFKRIQATGGFNPSFNTLSDKDSVLSAFSLTFFASSPFHSSPFLCFPRKNSWFTNTTDTFDYL